MPVNVHYTQSSPFVFNKDDKIIESKFLLLLSYPKTSPSLPSEHFIIKISVNNMRLQWFGAAFLQISNCLYEDLSRIRLPQTDLSI